MRILFTYLKKGSLPLSLLSIVFLFFIHNSYSQNYPVSDFDPHLQEIQAFPGAEGFGKYATGGRGGQVIKVTNLNDAGPGSLREAIDAYGTRIIIFEISGNIQLKSPLTIRNKNLTIAGPTAPGEGITLQNYSLVIYQTNNIIIRFIRSRPGDLSGIQGDALSIYNSSSIIIDQCSFSWGTDEGLSIGNSSNVTIQKSIISEGLNRSINSKGDHGFGSLLNGDNISFFQNLWAHFLIRNPGFSGNNSGGIFDFRNNVIYNWEFRASSGGSKSKINFFNNYYKPGPASKATGGWTPNYFFGATMDNNTPSTYGKFYLEGNKVVGRPIVDSNQWEGVRLESADLTDKYLESTKNKDQNGKLVSFPLPEGLNSVTRNADEAYQFVLDHVGASLFRDAVDNRVLQEVKNGTNTYKGSKTGLLGIIDSQKDVGGWPSLKTLAAPKDSDGDGMPDTWEIANTLDPKTANDKEYELNPYYTNIEVYINSLVQELINDQNPGVPTRATPILPVGNPTVSPVEVSFAWQPNNNATQYQIQISKNNDFSSNVISINNIKNYSVVYPELDANSTYFWRVRASNSVGNGAYSLVSTFKTSSKNIAPGSTILLSPVQNSTQVSLNPFFTWAKVPNSISYQIQIATDSGFSTLLVNQSGISTNEYPSIKLAENRVYYWRVRARNDFGAGSYSSVGTFKTLSYSNVPNTVIPVSPINQMIVSPININLKWMEEPSAQSYQIQVALDYNFTKMVFDKSYIEGNSYEIPNLNSNNIYYWRIRGRNRSGVGRYSGINQFRALPYSTTPNQIILNSPVHDSNLFTTSIAFSWTPDPIAQNYTFQLSTNENFTSFVANTSSLTSTSRTVSNLQPNTQYFWRIWGTNEAGNGPVSEVRKVRSATYSGTPLATNLVSPANNAVVASTDILFKWQNQPNTEFYRLEISESNTFSTIIFTKMSIRGTSWLVPSLTANKTYYWRIRTSNPAGTGRNSEVWKFTSSTGSVSLAQPILKSPINSAVNQSTNLSLSWNAIANATAYDVQISESNIFSSIEFSQTNIETLTTTFTSLLEGRTYYWRVRAKAGSTLSNWSDNWNFSTLGIGGITTLEEGLVGFWTMEESSANTLMDYSGNGNHAVLKNTRSVAWVPGVEGVGLFLPATVDRFAVAPHSSSLNITKAITVSAWIRPIQVGNRKVLSKSGTDGYEFGINSGGKVEFRFNGSSSGNTYRLVSNTNYPSDGTTWMHITVTFDGTNSRIYINGLLDSSASYSPVTIGANTSGLQIGAYLENHRWNGTLDEIRLYSRALAGSEVLNLLNSNEAFRIAPSQTQKGSSSNSDENATVLEKDPNKSESPRVTRMYPNPVMDQITLELSELEEERIQVSIFDMKGIQVLNQEYNSEKGTLVFDISKLGLNQGTYVLLVNTNGRQEVFKFLKMN